MISRSGELLRDFYRRALNRLVWWLYDPTRMPRNKEQP